MKHLSEMVGAFIMQGSEEMYRFNIIEISKEDASGYKIQQLKKCNAELTFLSAIGGGLGKFILI